MTPSTSIPAVLAVAAACLGVSACGGDDTGDPIPADKADRLAQRLDAIEASVAEGCVSVAAELRAAQTTVATLDDDGVGEDVQDALTDGLDKLRDLATHECAAQLEEAPETTPETTPVPSTPETTPEPTTPEPTTPEPTTPEPEPLPEVPDEEPDEGDGEGQFDPEDGGGAGPPGLEKKDKE
jgi:hypothetical protein